MPVLTSNERVQRLEKQGLQALRNRTYDKAEAIFRDQLAILRDFRYADEVTVAIALNNLALAMELQGKPRYENHVEKRANLHIAYDTAAKTGGVARRAV
jgi:hypothetical protein